MRVIKNRKIIDSPWRLERGEGVADIGGDGFDHVIVPLARWLDIRRTTVKPEPGARVGVLLRPDDAVESIAADLDRLSLVALEFGSFHEGRGYSQAAQLRQQHSFAGEIRALGAHRDNLPLMERCGIDAYELAEGETDHDMAQALSAFEEITVYYRRAG